MFSEVGGLLRNLAEKLERGALFDWPKACRGLYVEL